MAHEAFIIDGPAELLTEKRADPKKPLEGNLDGEGYLSIRVPALARPFPIDFPRRHVRHEIAGALQRQLASVQLSVERRLLGLLQSAEAELGGSPALHALRERLLTLESWISAPAPEPGAAQTP